MQIIRSADYRRMPWKNGGGETREIAVSPAGATLDALDWRVSLATVPSDGPFSMFQGIERTLCVIRGAGIRLQAGDREPADLYVTSEPYTFDGEVATHARLIDGPIVDLNVMSRRGRFNHRVRRLALDRTFHLETNAHTLLVYCQHGEFDIASGNLKSDDTAIFDRPAAPLSIAATQTAQIIVVELVAD